MAQLMREKVKRFAAVIVLILIVSVLSGCGAKRLNTKQIKRDFIAEHYFAYPLRNYFGKFPTTDIKNVETEKFKIITRLKTEEKDEMIIDASADDPKGVLRVTGEYSMTYVSVGDEWMLESFKVLSEQVIPLRTSSFSRDEITLALSFCGYDGVQSVKVLGRASDLKNKKDAYKIAAEYADGEKRNFALTFTFSPRNNGWSVLSAECKEI